MGYYVTYGPDIGKSESRKKKAARAAAWTAVLIIAASAGRLLWHSETLQLLLPGDPEITWMAAENLVSSIRQGSPVGQAVTVFCREIVEHGKSEIKDIS